MLNDRGQYTDSRQDANIDVLQLSFLTVINGPGGAPEVNFANAGDNCTTFDGTSLLNCPQIGYVVITTHIALTTLNAFVVRTLRPARPQARRFSSPSEAPPTVKVVSPALMPPPLVLSWCGTLLALNLTRQFLAHLVTPWLMDSTLISNLQCRIWTYLEIKSGA